MPAYFTFSVKHKTETVAVDHWVETWTSSHQTCGLLIVTISILRITGYMTWEASTVCLTTRHSSVREEFAMLQLTMWWWWWWWWTTYFSNFMSDCGDFVSLVCKFMLHLHLAFLVECHFFILPHLVHLDTLVKHLLHHSYIILTYTLLCSNSFLSVQCNSWHWTESVCVCVHINLSSTIVTTIFVQSSSNLVHGSHMQ